MGVPITYLDKYPQERAQLVDGVRWHVNGKYKYYRVIIRWRDGYLAYDRDPDEIQDIYEHFDESFLEKWYDEAMGMVETLTPTPETEAPVSVEPFDYKRRTTAVYRGDIGDAVKAAQSKETWREHMSSPLWQRVTES